LGLGVKLELISWWSSFKKCRCRCSAETRMPVDVFGLCSYI
jgi:hypothetical protein